MTNTAAPTSHPGTFTRMDESTAEQWAVIGDETMKNQPRVAEVMLDLVRQLESVTDGFAVNQLTHALQTATMAEQAGADEEMVFASLMHDAGKVVSVFNHPAISAEMIKPYVRDDVYRVILNHQDFQGRHYYQYFGKSQRLRDQYRDEPWFALCEQFTDEWDQQAFDPDRETYDLEHFAPLVRKLTAVPRFV
ncbi:MAG: HD domain-containing protein [Actinobacteria bacterium]|nr:HD domain-containing protein [Actinomycetota bacterium]